MNAPVLEKHLWIARDVASRISRKFDRPYEDMLDVAEFALVVELFQRRKHDPSKSSLNNWLWRVVYFYMLEVVTRGRHPRQENIAERSIHEFLDCDLVRSRAADDIQSDGMGSDAVGAYTRLMSDDNRREVPDRPHWLDNILQELSEEGKTLVKTIVEAPEEIAHAFLPSHGRPNHKKQREAVKSYLVDRLDWDWAKFHRAYREVEACL